MILTHVIINKIVITKLNNITSIGVSHHCYLKRKEKYLESECTVFIQKGFATVPILL